MVAKKKAAEKPAGNSRELRLRCLEAAVALGAPGATYINGSSSATVLENARDFYKFVTGGYDTAG